MEEVGEESMNMNIPDKDEKEKFDLLFEKYRKVMA